MARILIIDDDDLFRAMLRKMLEYEGYDVLDAPDGNTGMRLYRMQPTDLVITDIIMPEREGIEIIRELKSDFSEVKIIAVTGGGSVGVNNYLDIAKILGAQFTFEKPFRREKFLEAVRESLK